MTAPKREEVDTFLAGGIGPFLALEDDAGDISSKSAPAVDATDADTSNFESLQAPGGLASFSARSPFSLFNDNPPKREEPSRLKGLKNKFVL